MLGVVTAWHVVPLEDVMALARAYLINHPVEKVDHITREALVAVHVSVVTCTLHRAFFVGLSTRARDRKCTCECRGWVRCERRRERV